MPSSKIYNANPYITKSIKYINDNIKKKLSIDEICQYINLSKFYFSRIFKGVDINTVASKYEFYDLSHLNKNFIKVYGITPLEYQESCKIKNK